MMPDAERTGRTALGRIGRAVATTAALLLGIAAIVLVPPWVQVFWTGLHPDTRRSVSIGFLHGSLAGYGVALTLATIGGIASATALIRSRRGARRRPIAGRILLLSVATLFGLVLMEAGAWGFTLWSNQPPPPPAPPPPREALAGPPTREGGPPSSIRDELTVLVVGESTAEGQPFQPWLSIGHILAWQIEKARPGVTVKVRVMATGGVPLAGVYQQLAAQEEAPDLVVLCSGHNEFQARWGWGRVVEYYDEDFPEAPRRNWVDEAGDWTPFCGMIRDAVDRLSISMKPPINAIRAVVERPVCEPEARARILELFEQELDAVASWCEGAGAVPVFVAPAGNDVGFEPDRSILNRSTPPAQRQEFSRAFHLARERQKTDPAGAAAAYRELIAQEPGYAESHYRLAQILQSEGRTDEARREYALARDLDALPMRCPSDFRGKYAQVAGRHDLVLVDAEARFLALSPTRLLDDNVFHDGQHPTFRGYVDLAQAALDRLYERGDLGLPKGPAPRIDPEEVAARAGMTDERWGEVCRRSGTFWTRLADVRYDSEERSSRAEACRLAAEAIGRGARPEEAGLPGLGVHPPGFPRGPAARPEGRGGL